LMLMGFLPFDEKSTVRKDLAESEQNCSLRPRRGTISPAPAGTNHSELYWPKCCVGPLF
jgi:hypothetical protein